MWLLKCPLTAQIGESAEGKTLTFKTQDNRAADKILWEPGCTYELPKLRVVNKGNLAFKYKVIISGVNGNAKLLEAIDFTVNGEALADWDGILLPAGKTATTGNEVVGKTDLITISGTMKKEAGNEYQGLSIDGIGITVVASQYTYEYDSNDNTYDANADENTLFYSLAEFNELTEIPAGKTVYVNLNGASLEGGITIGNANIVDDYEYFTADQTDHGIYTKDMNYSKALADGKTKNLYSTEKPGFDLILTGTVVGAKDTGGFNAGMITLSVPDAANVTFEKVTFGAGQMALHSWEENLSYDPLLVMHSVNSLVFSGCTFNGNWIQNGNLLTNNTASNANLTFKNCTFNVHENTGDKNNSNPIWIQNMGQANVTIEGCTVNAVRPIKLWEGGVSGTVTIKNNKFNMSNFADATGKDVYKNVAVMFRGGNLGNVEITGNTVAGNATALVCFYDSTTYYPTMNEGATFKLSGNTLNGAKESVLWKSNTEWKPNYAK